MIWNFVFAGIALIATIYAAFAWRSSSKRYKETLANEARRIRMKKE